MKEIRLNIDHREIKALPGQNLLQVALENGIEVPHLCHDERVEAYGGCGLCVVEVQGNPRLVRACSTPVVEGMVVKTKTKRAHTARKVALELLLSDHVGDCRAPCMLACPAETDCQGYVGLIANGQYQEAVALIKEKLPLPSCIGRVCPHPCETACRRALVEEPVAIADLKWFVGDIDLAEDSFVADIKPATGKRIAVVGSGPAGLTAAYFLTREGHKVTIYEGMPETGGMLRYGIPEYRLPGDIIDKEVGLIEAMGVDIKTDHRLGRDISLDHLQNHYDAVFLGIGAWQSSSLRCQGEDMPGVYGGIDFLRQVTQNKPIQLGQKVLVVGGGNTAMDAARTAVRLGAKEVRVLYRRTRAEMPAEDIEVIEAEEEGVQFHFLVAPTEVLGDGRATGLKCQKMKLGEPDASGRRRPEPIPGEEEIFEADTIIAAIGQRVFAQDIRGLGLTEYGTIDVAEGTFKTNLPQVFAGGDAVTGPGIAIEAVDQGRKAALAIDGYLKGNLVPIKEKIYVKYEKTPEDFAHKEKKPRLTMRVLDPQVRRENFREMVDIMTEEEAKKEASRCLECGCGDIFECQLFEYMNQYDAQPRRLEGEQHHRQEAQDHPFILQNPDKCVLCGLCVRVCDEVMGIGALGLVDRGFDTIVKPEFGNLLKDTDCISCGQCVALCPVGALMEVPAFPKAVPVEAKTTITTCSFCSVGCKLLLETRGDLLVRALPEEDLGLLCARGRFGTYHTNDQDRLITPKASFQEGLSETSWQDALKYTLKRLQATVAAYGPGSVAFIASPRFTNEETLTITKLAKAIGTHHLGSFTLGDTGGLENVLGYNASTNSFDELSQADLILTVGDVAKNHPVLGVKIRQAGKGKAKIYSISPGKTRMDQEAKGAFHIDDKLDFFKGLVKAIFHQELLAKNLDQGTVTGLEELKKAVDKTPVTHEMTFLAQELAQSPKALVLVDEESVSPDAIKLLANIMVLLDKVGRPYNGIISLKAKNNSQGSWDLGIRSSGDEICQAIDQGKIKALMILGEDPLRVKPQLAQTLEKLEFLAVADEFFTATAKKAQVVLPLASAVESSGSYTRSDRKIQKVKRALKPRTSWSNLEVLTSLAQGLGLDPVKEKEVWQQIPQELAEYKHLSYKGMEDGLYWPMGDHPLGEQVLYHDGFATKDGKAHLFIPQEGKAFRQRRIYDTVELIFRDLAEKRGIKI